MTDKQKEGYYMNIHGLDDTPNDVLTRVRWSSAATWFILYSSLSLITCKDITDLYIYVSSQATLRARCGTHLGITFRYLGTCLGATITSIPLKEPLIKIPLFHHEAGHDMRLDLCQRMLCEVDTHMTLLPLERTFAHWCADFLPPRRSINRSAHSMAFFLSPFFYPGASWQSVYLYSTPWHFG